MAVSVKGRKAMLTYEQVKHDPAIRVYIQRAVRDSSARWM